MRHRIPRDVRPPPHASAPGSGTARRRQNGSWVPHLRSSRAQKPNQGRLVVAFHSAREGTANASPAPVDHAWAATILIYGATGYTGKLIAKSTVRSGSNAADLRLLPELQLLAQSPRCAYYRFPVHTERSRGAPAFSGCRANESNASARQFVPRGIAHADFRRINPSVTFAADVCASWREGARMTNTARIPGRSHLLLRRAS
jgi:hypothetical protein